MSLFNKKYLLDPLQEKAKHNRRNFMTKAAAALFGAVLLSRAEDLFAVKSKTGYLYIKQNGEVVKNYKPSAGSEPFLSQLGIFAFNFAPQGWALCNGQLLSIATNQALFSLLGTSYGGNGSTNFALPDLRGRSPIHFGQGMGLSNYVLGQSLGSENVNLITSQLPAHNHGFVGNSSVGNLSDPAGNFVAQCDEGVKSYSGASNTVMNSAAVSNAGGSQSHSNIQPYLTISYCVAIQGLFPSQE